MGYVLKAVLSSAQHPEYGQITVPFPIPDEKYDRMIELLEPLEIGDALRQDCRVDELDSFYTVLNRLVGSLVNFDELDYLAKRLDSFDDGEAAQFQGMACKLGVSNIKDFINLTFCCQQATVITDFSDLDAIGRQHYMTMQGGGCRIEELERLDGRKFALDLILNHLEGRITPYGVVYDTNTCCPHKHNDLTLTPVRVNLIRYFFAFIRPVVEFFKLIIVSHELFPFLWADNYRLSTVPRGRPKGDCYRGEMSCNDLPWIFIETSILNKVHKNNLHIPKK